MNKSNFKEIEPLVLAKEKTDVSKYRTLFQDEYTKKDGAKGTRSYFPTEKQLLYVRYIFEGKSKREACKLAGYSKRSRWSIDKWISQIECSFAVTRLMSLVIGNYFHNRELSAKVLLDKALKVYDRCDTVHEQLATLKFIKSLMPKDFNTCNSDTCPFKKK